MVNFQPIHPGKYPRKTAPHPHHLIWFKKLFSGVYPQFIEIFKESHCIWHSHCNAHGDMNANTPPPRTDSTALPADSRGEGLALPRYVRVLKEAPNGMVVFEFALGWPDLATELVMPRPAFQDFCEKHGVIFVTEAPKQLGDAHDEH